MAEGSPPIQLEWAYNRLAPNVPLLRGQAAHADPFASWGADQWRDALDEAGCVGISLRPDRIWLANPDTPPGDRVVSYQQPFRERNPLEMAASIVGRNILRPKGDNDRTLEEIKRRVGMTVVAPHRDSVNQLLKWRNRLQPEPSEGSELKNPDLPESTDRIPVQLYPEREPLRRRSHLLRPERQHYRDIFPDAEWIRTFQIEPAVIRAWNLDPEESKLSHALVNHARQGGYAAVYDPAHLPIMPNVKILANGGILNAFDVSAGRTDIHDRSSDAGKESLEDLWTLAQGNAEAFKDRKLGILFRLAVDAFYNAPPDRPGVKKMQSRPFRAVMEFPPQEVQAVASELKISPKDVYVNAGRAILATAEAA